MSLNEKRQEWNVFPSCLFESIKLFKSFLMKRKFYKNLIYHLTNLKYGYKILEKAMTERSTVNYRSQRAGGGEMPAK